MQAAPFSMRVRAAGRSGVGLYARRLCGAVVFPACLHLVRERPVSRSWEVTFQALLRVG